MNTIFLMHKQGRDLGPAHKEFFMKCKKILSDLYHMYITGNLQKREFEGRIFQYLLGNYEQYTVFDRNQDRWDEFLSWLYPRLKRAIDLYRDLGSSFDAYITSLVYNASREYRCREMDHRITEYICWQARAEELRVCEGENEYPEGPKVSIPEGIKPRHILLLLLKSYYFVSDEYVKRVASVIGMESNVVLNMVDELRILRSGKEAEIMDLRERLYSQYYRCLAYQKRLNNAQSGMACYEKMKGRFERAKQRFLTMRKRLKGMRLDVSNRMIADVIGIPKGTVDSCLFAIRNHPAFPGKQNRDQHIGNINKC